MMRRDCNPSVLRQVRGKYESVLIKATNSTLDSYLVFPDRSHEKALLPLYRVSSKLA
jgi:hypothetical protein